MTRDDALTPVAQSAVAKRLGTDSLAARERFAAELAKAKGFDVG